MVISFSLRTAAEATLHLQIIRVRLVRVKGFIGPHYGDHVCITKVFDVMDIPGGYIHHFQLISANVIFDCLIRADFPKTDDAGATDHQELFILTVVPVVAFGDARLGNVDGHLSSIRGLEKLGKRAPVIHVHFIVFVHIILLLLISGEDAGFRDVCGTTAKSRTLFP